MVVHVCARMRVDARARRAPQPEYLGHLKWRDGPMPRARVDTGQHYVMSPPARPSRYVVKNCVVQKNA